MKRFFRSVIFLLLLLTAVFCSALPAAAVDADGNIVIMLDPGHSENSSDGSRSGTHHEAYYNMKIALACKEALEANGGFSVYLSHSEDNRTEATLLQRMQAADAVNADVVISLHVDGNEYSSGMNGAEAFVSVLPAYAMTELGERICRSLEKNTELAYRGIYQRQDSGDGTHIYYWDAERQWDVPDDRTAGSLSDYYGIITWGCKFGIRTLIIEHGFFTNAHDAAILEQDDALTAMGKADAAAIIDYYLGHTHTYTEELQRDYPSNCLWQGKASHICTVCGARYGTTSLSEAEDGHCYIVTDHKDATCTEDGYTVYTCRIAANYYDKSNTDIDLEAAGEQYTVTEPATGHSYSVTKEVKATHGCDGYRDEVCSLCGEKRHTVLKGEEHTLSEHIHTEPTCTEDGCDGAYCTVCGVFVGETLPMTGHTMEETERTEPTEEADGYSLSVCSVCGYTENTVLPMIQIETETETERITETEPVTESETDTETAESAVPVMAEPVETETNAPSPVTVPEKTAEKRDRERLLMLGGVALLSLAAAVYGLYRLLRRKTADTDALPPETLSGTENIKENTLMSTLTLQKPLTVVLPDAPSQLEETAAAELVKFLAEMTGDTPVTVKESTYDGKPAFLLNTKNTPFSAKEAYEAAVLGEEGTFYAVDANGVFIGGGAVRGVLYSVYTFLEDELGCHCFTEELTVIPKRETLTLDEKVCVFVPKMHYRAASFADGEAPHYAVFNKLNARTKISDAYGGAIDFGIGFVHTLPHLIPDSLYETHPEYFPLIDGERKHGGWTQRCLTNPDVLRMTIDAVLADFRANPSHKTASVSQADTGEESNACTCPACRAVNEEEGSMMGTQLRFVNAVADAVREEFPDRFIETLAYRFTRHICKKTKPRDNVIIRLCSIECCFSHPIDECTYSYSTELAEHGNPSFVRDMRDWAAISKCIYIWDYVTNFAHYLVPQPNLYVLKPNMQFFVNNATVGMFPEGAPDARGSECSELKSWLLAKLEWNPDFDAEKGIRDFMTAFAGAGAEPLLAYLDRLNRRPAVTGSHRSCYATPDRDFFSPEFMAEAERDFDAAKAAVTDEATLRRIRRLEMSVRYVRIVLYSDTFTEEALEKEIRQFVADMPVLGISKIHEGGTLEGAEEALRARIQK